MIYVHQVEAIRVKDAVQACERGDLPAWLRPVWGRFLAGTDGSVLMSTPEGAVRGEPVDFIVVDREGVALVPTEDFVAHYHPVQAAITTAPAPRVNLQGADVWVPPAITDPWERQGYALGYVQIHAVEGILRRGAAMPTGEKEDAVARLIAGMVRAMRDDSPEVDPRDVIDTLLSASFWGGMHAMARSSHATLKAKIYDHLGLREGAAAS